MVDVPKDPPRTSADILYGGKPNAASRKADAKSPLKAPSSNETRSDTDRADELYDSPASVLSSYKPHLADAFNRYRDATGLSARDAEAALTEMAVAFSDARIPPEEAARLHALILEHALSPADGATIAGWATDTRRELRERYGDDAENRLAAAKAFVDARPTLKKLLNEGGVGSHPSIVLALAENPHGLRMTPRSRRAG